MRRATTAGLVALACVLAACAADDEPAPTATVDDDSTAVIVTTTVIAAVTTTVPTTATTAAAPDTTVPAAATSIDPGTASPAPTTTTTVPIVGEPVVARELVGSFRSPIDLAVRADDPAMYIVEQGGRVVRFVDGNSTVVADVSDRLTTGGGEQGLLGLAFSPDGARAYLNYTASGGGATVIAEYPVSADGVFDRGSERVVITVDQPYGNHNAGDLEFGPDGYLYIPLGDGGSGGDPERRSSDPSSLLGTMLRIDPAATSDAAYGVPADNPFVGGEFDGRTDSSRVPSCLVRRAPGGDLAAVARRVPPDQAGWAAHPVHRR